MLRTRVLTAIVMLIVAMGVVFALPNAVFAVIAGSVILGIGGWEAGRLTRLSQPWQASSFGAGLVLLSILGWVTLPHTGLMAWLALACVTWLMPMYWLNSPKRKHNSVLIGVLLGVFLSAAWLSLVELQAMSPWLIVLVLLIIAAADIGAYFSGRAIGGAKLAPQISPGKTWAGAIGGVIMATVAAPVGLMSLPIDLPFSLPQMALLGLILAPISIVGDLFISLLKRHAGLKDSSNLLPGHGGVLDRLDSLGAALPFFALALAWANHA